MLSRFVYLMLAFVFFAADQFSKWLVTENIIRPLVEGREAQPLALSQWLSAPPLPLPPAATEVTPFLNIVMVWNRGMSFGLFNEHSDWGPLLLIAVAIAIVMWFTLWLFKGADRTQSLAIALVIGGAIGNVFDRVRFGAVIDFLDFHVMGYHWPAFNISDSCICIGVLVLIAHSFWHGEKKAS